MKTNVEFRSDKFPPYEGEDEIINPGLWGKRLAEYLGERMEGEGIETGEILPEDWGWVLRIKNDAFPLWIGCGHYEEFPNGFLCCIEPGKPVIRRFFKKIDTTEQVGRVAEALDRILTSDPEVTDLRWWNEDEK